MNIPRDAALMLLSALRMSELDRKSIVEESLDSEYDLPVFVCDGIHNTLGDDEWWSYPIFNSILLDKIITELIGVSNLYISKNLQYKGVCGLSVYGDKEELVFCRCCGYKTLKERGGYEICRVCDWEDDGSYNSQSYSSVNQLFLPEARSNFSEFGSCHPYLKEQDVDLDCKFDRVPVL